MKLQSGETIVKVYHHDLFSFIIRGVKVWGASLPFFFLAVIFSLSNVAPIWVSVAIYAGIIGLFALVHAYDFLMYYLDTLVLTNQRIVHLDWITPFKYTEVQAMLDDIQNIESRENGFLSMFRLFDYGLFMVETASTKTVIKFEDAPDPEGIKFFCVNLARKHIALVREVNEEDVNSLSANQGTKKNPGCKVANSK